MRKHIKDTRVNFLIDLNYYVNNIYYLVKSMRKVGKIISEDHNSNNGTIWFKVQNRKYYIQPLESEFLFYYYKKGQCIMLTIDSDKDLIFRINKFILTKR